VLGWAYISAKDGPTIDNDVL